MKLQVDQMPNELILDASTTSPIQLNLTGIFLRDFSELDFSSIRNQQAKESAYALTPSALSTVGLRRATESHIVEVFNCTGIDLEIEVEGSSVPAKTAGVRFDSYGPGLIPDKGKAFFDSLFDNIDLQQNIERIANQTPKFALRIPSEAAEIVGERESIKGLPVTSSAGESVSTIHLLKPDSLLHVTSSHHERSCLTPSRRNRPKSDRFASFEDESVLTSNSIAPDYAYYHAEPVVEWCMQNQRLRSSTVDLYSLDKGRDLLSSSYWSPEEDYNVESIGLAPNQGLEATFEGILDDSEAAIERQVYVGPSNIEVKPLASNWLRPYLKNDSPEVCARACVCVFY
jgi:hypothetical protein